MKVPVIQKFLFCIELRPATLGIGWGYGILLTISFVSFLLALLGNNTNHGANIATSLISLVAITFCVLLVLGVQRDKANYVHLGMWFLIVHAVLLVISCLVSLFSVGLFVLLIYLPFTIYCALTVRSYYLQMIGQNDGVV